MSNYNKITALYSRLSVGDEDRDGGESNSIQNQKIFLENYAKGQQLTNIRHYIDDDESGRFFDRSAYSRMIEDVESGKIGVCIMKDLTRWGRDYLQVGNAMEIFRRNNVRFIAVNNGIDSENPDTLEFAPFINIMSEWYAKDISKKVKTGSKTKGMSGKPVATEAPYGYIKDPDNKDFWIIDKEAAEVVRLIFRLFLDGKNRNQIAVYLTQEQIPTPTFYMKDRGRGTCKNKTLNENNRYKGNALLWRKAWADISNSYLEHAGSTERIDHRSNAERGIDEIPTVHMGVAACQMEKKGIATEKGELNRAIRKSNRLIKEIRAQIGNLKEWIAGLLAAWETAPRKPQPPKSPNLANLLMRYLSVQREKSRKYSQSWQHQHAADELKTISQAANYLAEHGISTLDELDASLSSVSDEAFSIREGMKTAEQRMKELQKLIENGENYLQYKPIHAELKKLKNGWTNKRDKYEEAHRAELTLWNAASRYLHANLTDTKTLPISEWKQEYADLKAQRDTDYTKLKAARAEVAELQKIRKCVDIALKAEQPEQTQNRTKRQEQER